MSYLGLFKNTLIGIGKDLRPMHFKLRLYQALPTFLYDRPNYFCQFNKKYQDQDRPIENGLLQAIHGHIIKKHSYKSGQKIQAISELEESLETLSTEFNEELGLQEKDEFNEMLAALISAYFNLGDRKKAHDTFDFFFKNMEKNDISSTIGRINIYPCNEILKVISLEENTNFEKINVVINYMVKETLAPDANTFAYIFTALGRSLSHEGSYSKIQEIFQWMKNSNISIEDSILASCAEGASSFDYCVKAIQTLKPDLRKNLWYLNITKENLIKNCTLNHILFNDHNAYLSKKTPGNTINFIKQSEFKQLVEEQVENETKNMVAFQSILSKQNTTDQKWNHEKSQKYNEWKQKWHIALHSSLTELKKNIEVESQNIATILEPNSHYNMRLYDLLPYIKAVNIDKIVDLLLKEAEIWLFGKKKLSLKEVFKNVGVKYYNIYLTDCMGLDMVLSNKKELHNKYCEWYMGISEGISNIPRIQFTKMELENLINGQILDIPKKWPSRVYIMIGRRLCDVLLSSLTWHDSNNSDKVYPVFEMVPGYGLQGSIRPNRYVSRELFNKIENYICSPHHIPMLTPPLPFTRTYNGGFFNNKYDLIRLDAHSHKQRIRLKEAGDEIIYPIMDTANYLGSIPWKINCEMVDFMIEVMNNGGWSKVGILPTSDVMPQNNYGQTDKERAEEMAQRRKLKSDRGFRRDTRHFEKNLSLANHYRDKVFWIPHGADFKGRFQVKTIYLMHHSKDSYRAMMTFAKGKKLGKDGLNWLKLHLINLSGLKKNASFDEQLDYCETIMEDVIDSAEDPINGRRWWTQSKTPLQTLAACKEVVAAWRSADHEQFESCLPVHHDGSSNALQHFAALALDDNLAYFTNLKASSTSDPRCDFYQQLLNSMEEQRRKDAENGSEVAAGLDGVLTRQLIKKIVMSYVSKADSLKFGSTIWKHIESMVYNKGMKIITDGEKNPVSYITDCFIDAMGKISSHGVIIHDWMKKVAKAIVVNCDQPIEFVMPFGYPVVEPYMTVENSPDQSGYIWKVNKVKQENSFTPSLIQGLEATHLMLTAMGCQRAGIDFAAVHDSYWTQASSVSEMSEICREQFTSLYSQPIIDNIAEYMKKIYSDNPGFCETLSEDGKDSLAMLLSNVPKIGDFDINEVRDSVYFFS